MWRKQLALGEPAVSLTQKEEARRAGGPLALPQEDTHMGCATWAVTPTACTSPSSNPRAPGGRDPRDFLESAILDPVSIHAPLGGATVFSQHYEDTTKNTVSRRTAGVLPRKRGVVVVRWGRMSGCPAVLSGCEPAGVWLAAAGSRVEIQMMSGPLRSSTALAPMCSTLVCQLLPR